MAQWEEMISDPEYKIGRPRQLYNGTARRRVPPTRDLKPIEGLFFRKRGEVKQNRPCLFHLLPFISTSVRVPHDEPLLALPIFSAVTRRLWKSFTRITSTIPPPSRANGGIILTSWCNCLHRWPATCRTSRLSPPLPSRRSAAAIGRLRRSQLMTSRSACCK